MKKFFKLVPSLLVSACVLVSACACSNGTDANRRHKTEPEIRHAEPLDPDFSVDPDKEPDEKPEDPECPDCPEKDDADERAPKQKRHHHCKHKKRRPVPFPRPPKKED